MLCYVDSSALVKRYARESGSAWVRALVEPRAENSIYITQIGTVEVAAGLSQKVRTKEIAPSEYESALELFMRDIRNEEYNLLPVDNAMTNLAIELTRRHPLRGYDAVHLAAAIRLNQVLVQNGLPPATFVSADQLLCDAAAKEGLTAENPNAHEPAKPAEGK
jgi:predicted nucleic acid-binding protein